MDFIPKVNVPLEVCEETTEEDPNFVYEAQGEELEEQVEELEDFTSYEEEEETFIPKAKPKKVIQEDIFLDPEIKETKPKKQRKLNKNGKERKPMTEEHKEKLKFARERALEAKREKAEERKLKKEEDAEEKQLLKLKKRKDIEKLKREVAEDRPAPAPVPQVREIIREPSLTREDIEKAQLNAIMSYETIRKQRKEDKRKVVAKEAEYNHLRSKLMKAQNPTNNFSASRGFF